MFRFLLIFFLVLSITSKAQIQWAQGCDVSTLTINTFFPGNTTTVYSNTTIPGEVLYLCGPNTTVYDTLLTGTTCRSVLINPGCIHYTNTKGCLWFDGFMVKNTGTLVISSTANSSTIRIWYEPAATIINYTSGAGTQSFVCTAITFPTVSCATSITENNKQETIFIVYPNPSSSKINIEALNFNAQSVDISIIDQLGKIIYYRKEWALSEKAIPIDNFANGLYFIQIRTKQGQQTEKLLVNR